MPIADGERCGACGSRVNCCPCMGTIPGSLSTLSHLLAGHRLVIDEQFDGFELDRTRWVPYYLPQWAGRERSRAHYRLTNKRLELFIADDQPAWLPEVEGDLRVSSLQTGCFAGPVGSTIGQHRTNHRMVVVEEQPVQRHITPMFGAVELRASWIPHLDYMVAFWMIGFEDQPHRSAEICVCEIFGSDVSEDMALVGMGVHPFGDPTIVDEFDKVSAAIDVRAIHDYAAVWTPGDITFFIDGEPVKRVEQSPQYPMQLMLNMYGFGADPDRPACQPFIVHRVRVHEPVVTSVDPSAL